MAAWTFAPLQSMSPRVGVEISCVKRRREVSDRMRLRPASSALGEHIAVTEEAAGHRKASRSSVEASDLRRTVAGTEPLPAHHVMCLG